jgi:hypothetical protein
MDPITESLELVAATRAQVERDRAYLQQLWRRLAATEIVIRESALALHQSSARLWQLATGDGPIIRTSRPP